MHLFDTFKCKASEQAINELDTALSAPITFDEFFSALHSKHGGRSPGPSGVTINHLKLLSDHSIRLLHTTLSYFYAHHHVPHLWTQRIMTLIPKVENPSTFSQYRPIMLLDDVRKLWLSILKRRRDPILYKHQLLNPSQCGGISRSGTEDAILAAVNCIEDSHERNTELHIVILDKQRAFDAPRRKATINLAWRRLGISQAQANYITALDENNEIYAKTPQFLLHPHDTPFFTAEGGSSQGDTDATFNYNVVEDITLDFLHSLQHKQDWYYFRTAHNNLQVQPPTEFIDDTHIYSRSIAGAQRTLDLYRLIGLVLNIYNNPSKFHHLSLRWEGALLLNHDTSILQAYDEQLVAHPIPPTPSDSLTRFLGAFITSDNTPDHNLSRALEKSNSICSTLQSKKTEGHIISTVVYQSVYPSLSYPLRFSNLSTHQLKKVASPLHHLIKSKNHLDDFSHAVIFNNSATPYGMHHHNFTSYVNACKLGSYRRMAQGSKQAQHTIHSLIARTMRYLGAWDNPSSSPTHVPSPPLRGLPKPLPTWGASLVDWIRPALQPQLNFPHPVHPAVTHTPLTDLLQSTDNLSSDDLQGALSHSNIIYLEELYPHHMVPPRSHSTHLEQLLNFFPATIHNFIDRVYREGLRRNITHGHVTLHNDLFYNNAHILNVTNDQQLYLRIWPTPRITHSEWQNTRQILSFKDNLEFPIVRNRNLTIESSTPTHYKYKDFLFPQKFHLSYDIPSSDFSFNIPSDFLSSIPQCDLIVYTDCSYKSTASPEGLQLPSDSISAISLIISTEVLSPLRPGPFASLYANGTSFLSNPYQAELLAAAVASSLSTATRSVHIVTDSKSIVTQIEHLRNTPESIPRTDITPFLLQLINSNTTFTWVKSHSNSFNNTITDPLQHGNQIADHQARNISPPVWASFPSSHTRIQLSDLLPKAVSPTSFTNNHQVTIPSSRAISQHIERLRINDYITTRHTTFYQHHHEWLNFSWTATGNAHKKLLKLDPFPIPLSKRRSTRYFFKTLYDKYRNLAYKFKIENPNNSNTSNPLDPPNCPLCNQNLDSMTHLFCSCPHVDIALIRSNCISALKQEATASNKAHQYTPFINALSLDSRSWACLLPLTETTSNFITTASLVLSHTIPAVQQMWKVYNQHTHVTHQATHPISQLSHNILSNNLRIITIDGPSPQAILRPQHNRSIRPTPQSLDIRQFLVPIPPQIAPSPPSQWQTPTSFTRRVNTPATTVLSTSNSFALLPVEPITPGGDTTQYVLPAPRTPIRYYPSAPIEPYVASSTTHAKRHLASQIDHTFHEAAGDGNCLLNAFLMGLQIQTTMYDPTLHTPDNLRHEIFNFLNTPQGLGLREQNHMTDRELLEILPVPGQRPTHLEHASATALSLLFQLNINIYCLWYSNNSYSTDSFLHIAQATAPTITLIHHYNHYDYLQPSQAAPD